MPQAAHLATRDNILPTLPASLRFIERGWLNANHVLFLHRDGNVLIDSAYCTHADATVKLLREPGALGDAPLARVLNTHCHSDHMGGNARLQAEYGCEVWVPEGERAHLEHWDGQALWLDVAGQQAEPFRVDGLIRAGDTLLLGGTEWQAVAAPGHRMEALMFHSPEFRLLISGDALWENGLGVVEPTDERFLDAAIDTLDVIGELDVDWVIPGHGRLFGDVPAALDRARSRLRALEGDPVKRAKAMMKALLMFNLLEKQRMPLADMPAYLDGLAFYRDMNRLYLGLDHRELAEMLVGELLRVRALDRQGDWLVPLVAA